MWRAGLIHREPDQSFEPDVRPVLSISSACDFGAIARSGDEALLARGPDGVLLRVMLTAIEDDAVRIDTLAVSPRAQGLGIGSHLLTVAEHIARTAGRSSLRLYTNEVMTENLSYYPRCGFVETHRAIENDFRRAFFVKTLTG
ncbi:N-acetyltransferase [Naasia sp. SYSU D00057]|uniref:GNAT family N-acetyltransferase n=1 Tax=Naasia sp. SYSU D00057 TaxID=2817380 RepID=UPI001B30A79E|nr:GNAT family N-acetyltransferase [Naasia sp. SYSU D00057]